MIIIYYLSQRVQIKLSKDNLNIYKYTNYLISSDKYVIIRK